MKLYSLTFIVVAILLLSTTIDAKKKKHKSSSSSSSPSTHSKTKTKWSSSTDLGPNGGNAAIASEVHGYYIKRTYMPANSTEKDLMTLKSPPYLAIPIAWFKCEADSCQKGNSVAVNGNSNAISEGFLCDDDCVEPYAPICGKTPTEVAVFYNKCKLNVAKCRTHGLWLDLSYEECKQLYPKELEYTEKKFKTSPYFKDNAMMPPPKPQQVESENSSNESEQHKETEMSEKLPEMESSENMEQTANSVESSTKAPQSSSSSSSAPSAPSSSSVVVQKEKNVISV